MVLRYIFQAIFTVLLAKVLLPLLLKLSQELLNALFLFSSHDQYVHYLSLFNTGFLIYMLIIPQLQEKSTVVMMWLVTMTAMDKTKETKNVLKRRPNYGPFQGNFNHLHHLCAYGRHTNYITWSPTLLPLQLQSSALCPSVVSLLPSLASNKHQSSACVHGSLVYCLS